MIVVGLAVTGSSADCIRKTKGDACGLERPINCGPIPGTDKHKCCAVTFNPRDRGIEAATTSLTTIGPQWPPTTPDLICPFTTPTMESDNLWHSDAFGRVVEIGREDRYERRLLRAWWYRSRRQVAEMWAGSHESLAGASAGPLDLFFHGCLEMDPCVPASPPNGELFQTPSHPATCSDIYMKLFWPQSLEGTLRNNGSYDQVCAFDREYPRVARNHKENRNKNGDLETMQERETEEESLQPLLPEEGIEMTPIPRTPAALATTDENILENMDDDFDALLPRHFGPRFLCFLQYDSDGNVAGCETRLVVDWVREHGDDSDTDFVFLSYTRRQFCVATPEELTNWNVDATAREALSHIAPNDREMLRKYGIEAALSAGKSAFWLDFECIRDADGLSKATSQSNDVYRICDIVRAAHSLAILVGPPLQSRYSPATNEPYSPEAVVRWLQEWGTRLWTLPEILLISSEKRVKIYAVDGPRPPLEWSKRHFASRSIWRDAKLVRQLIDHYESSIHLKPLELVSIALDCFTRRATDQFNQADIVYALMGLLRRRPAINTTDTSFIAGDYWSAKLWDIEPGCQVAGIVDDGTVTLDGAYGATIQWDSMEQIYFFKRPTFLHNFAKVLLRGAPVYFLFGLSLTIAGAVTRLNGAPTLGLLIPGVVVLIPTVLILLSAPAMLYHIYDGKFWSTQALFVGMEGVPASLGFVEERLFGSDRGRLRWSAAGSRLSRHELSPEGDEQQLPMFTLVDTYSMTAIAFRSARPPTAVVVFGREGGMQRAALCSYDWKRNTFAREQVVRLKTTVLDRMLRMDRFRFSLERREFSETDRAHGRIGTRRPREPVPKLDVGAYVGGSGVEKWTTDLVLLPCMFFISGQTWTRGDPRLTSLLYFVGFFLVQPFVPLLFRRIPMGQVTGWAGLLACSCHMDERTNREHARPIPIRPGRALSPAVSRYRHRPAHLLVRLPDVRLVRSHRRRGVPALDLVLRPALLHGPAAGDTGQFGYWAGVVHNYDAAVALFLLLPGHAGPSPLDASAGSGTLYVTAVDHARYTEKKRPDISLHRAVPNCPASGSWDLLQMGASAARADHTPVCIYDIRARNLYPQGWAGPSSERFPLRHVSFHDPIFGLGFADHRVPRPGLATRDARGVDGRLRRGPDGADRGQGLADGALRRSGPGLFRRR
ncbi:hypothetical protein PG997_001454 [Apiospora hydei]|uniref:3-hydroxyisobutyrate dehydrogenase protein n=1 Tax=Apiospora hydei TaxID=1337664 RepID=A0ABR1XDR1_9PEZI